MDKIYRQLTIRIENDKFKEFKHFLIEKDLSAQQWLEEKIDLELEKLKDKQK